MTFWQNKIEPVFFAIVVGTTFYIAQKINHLEGVLDRSAFLKITTGAIMAACVGWLTGSGLRGLGAPDGVVDTMTGVTAAQGELGFIMLLDMIDRRRKPHDTVKRSDTDT